MKLKTEHKKLNAMQHQLDIEFDWDEVVKRIPETPEKFRKKRRKKSGKMMVVVMN